MNPRTWALGLLSVSLIWGPAARANDSVTVGVANYGSCYPFSCAASSGISLFQQVFKGSSFTGAGYITSFDQTLYTELDYGPGILDSATYEIGFSTQSTYPLSPSPVDNIGLDYAAFGVYSLGGLSPNVLSFSGTPFYFDPAQGNLVMTVLISDYTNAGDGLTFYNADEFTDSTARCFGDVATCKLDGKAPVTTFHFTSSLPAPAPLPWLGLGAAFRFSRKYRQRLQAIRRHP